MIKLYQYPKCSTCRKAVKFLNDRGFDCESIDISQRAPSTRELRAMLKHQDGNLRRLFNTSGMQYRELNLKERLPTMTQDEAIQLLSTNGMLVKRPFVLVDGLGLVGFKEAVWQQAL